MACEAEAGLFHSRPPHVSKKEKEGMEKESLLSL